MPSDASSTDPTEGVVSERERFTFECERASNELRHRELDLQIRREELKRHGSIPLFVAILAGLVALSGNAVVALIQGRANRDLERKKFEAQLISKAVDVDDQELAARNLAFLLKAGLVEDEGGRIASLVSRPKDIPIQNVEDNQLIEVGTENFDEEILKSSVPTIVIFTAPWAGPGRVAEQALLAEAAKVTYVKIRKVNLDENPELHRKYQLQLVPVFMLFVNGAPVRTEYGAMSPNAMRLLIEVARLHGGAANERSN
jgi:thiol-disulfide isomerase/thioredoxin